MSDTAPVVVVGGGLTGSGMAILLAKRGHKVVLFERRPDFRKETASQGFAGWVSAVVRRWCCCIVLFWLCICVCCVCCVCVLWGLMKLCLTAVSVQHQ